MEGLHKYTQMKKLKLVRQYLEESPTSARLVIGPSFFAKNTHGLDIVSTSKCWKIGHLSCHCAIVGKERLYVSIEMRLVYLFLSSKQKEQLKQKEDKKVRSVSNSFAMIQISFFLSASTILCSF